MCVWLQAIQTDGRPGRLTYVPSTDQVWVEQTLDNHHHHQQQDESKDEDELVRGDVLRRRSHWFARVQNSSSPTLVPTNSPVGIHVFRTTRPSSLRLQAISTK